MKRRKFISGLFGIPLAATALAKATPVKDAGNREDFIEVIHAHFKDGDHLDADKLNREFHKAKMQTWDQMKIEVLPDRFLGDWSLLK